MANLFHGNAVMSAFQLARGYAPSVAGVPSSKVPTEMLEAHIQVSATRAVQKALRSNRSKVVQQNALKPGTKVWIFYNSSKQNERVRWIPARVVSAEKHIVMCRRSD